MINVPSVDAHVSGEIPKPAWDDGKVAGLTSGVAIACALAVGLLVFVLTRAAYRDRDGTEAFLGTTPALSSAPYNCSVVAGAAAAPGRPPA